jgi:hypothetical protein
MQLEGCGGGSVRTVPKWVLTIQPPRDLTRILKWHFWWMEDRFSNTNLGFSGTSVIEAILKCGVQWEEREIDRNRAMLLPFLFDDYVWFALKLDGLLRKTPMGNTPELQ